MTATRTTLVVAVALAALISVAGCTTSVDKAGGQKVRQTTTLHVLNTRSSDEVQPFVDEVAALSKGTLRLDIESKWERGSPTSEADAIRAIQAGRADLGVDAARAWHEVGVTSFDALVAPMAVDSMALQEKVLAGSLPDQMLAGLTPLGFDGIGILPGVMRRPGGITRPLLSASDFKGARIAVGAGTVTDHALRALGAVPVASGFEGADISALDGIEQQASSVGGSLYDGVVRTITENVDLWPRPLVIFGGASSMNHLSEQQVGWLRAAARASVHATAVAQMAGDTEQAMDMCRRGRLSFVDATPEQLELMRSAFQSVYAWLRQDDQTQGFLDQLTALRGAGIVPYSQESLSCSASTPSSGPTGVPSTSSAASATSFDGTYRMVTTAQDGPHPGVDAVPENWGTWIFVFDHGRFAITQENTTACTWGYGTYAVTGQHVEWVFTDGGGVAPTGATNKPGEDFVFNWNRYRDTMTLTAVAGAISPDNFFLQAWHQLSSKPNPRYLSTRCPPPSNALTG